MSFPRSKRQLLAWLALLAPLPLPFNEALEWWVLLVYSLLVVHLLQRLEGDRYRPLPDWVLNLLGLAYLPLLVVDLERGVRSSSFLDPLLHLLLFVLVVKLYALRQEREKWHVLIAVFFVFAGGMATSSHVSILLYLVAFVALGTVALLRLAHFHVLATFGRETSSPAAGLPVRTPVAWSTVLVVLLAIPLFALMPRFRDPFVFGQGGPNAVRRAGFSDSVDLSSTSSIRGNRAVVMRLTFDGPPPTELRFKAATYDVYRERRWIRRPRLAVPVTPWSNQEFVFAGGRRRATAEVQLEPLRSASLALPLETLSVRGLNVPALLRDPGGAYLLPMPPREALHYRLELGDEPVIRAADPDDPRRSALDESGLTPRIRALAREVMGEGPDGERIDRLERHLLREYAYTLDFVGRGGSDPLEAFLFDNRRGHCELFASAMVLMLRAEGIPARLVAGFLDAERTAFQGYYIVRQDNAHAWVEAYAPERGWRAYDPTPPEGRPHAAEWSLRLMATQLYDFLIFRWDRYVLSFGADDQADVFDSVRAFLSRSWQRLLAWLPRDRPAPAPPAAAGEPLESPPPAASRPARAPWPLLLLAPLIALLASLGWWWRRRRPPTATAAYRRLRRLLSSAGHRLTDALAPRAVENLAASRYPAAAPAVHQLVGLYLEESFGERPLHDGERRRLREALAAVADAVSQPRRRH
ncbi:MAG: DUF3488 domain-containing protein [Acidobacteria bacterium]|nr:MAG: DUF3488 domain-containing protein [Acidobacteriota bacterium]